MKYFVQVRWIVKGVMGLSTDPLVPHLETLSKALYSLKTTSGSVFCASGAPALHITPLLWTSVPIVAKDPLTTTFYDSMIPKLWLYPQLLACALGHSSIFC